MDWIVRKEEVNVFFSNIRPEEQRRINDDNKQGITHFHGRIFLVLKSVSA